MEARFEIFGENYSSGGSLQLSRGVLNLMAYPKMTSTVGGSI